MKIATKVNYLSILFLIWFLMSCDEGDEKPALRTYEGNLVFSYQMDIDNFKRDCYSTINGNVTIGLNTASDIYNLKGLSCITEIRGNLIIIDNPLLKTLEGLENLTSIGKNLQIEANGIERFDGLQNLGSIGGNMHVIRGSALAVEGFDQLQSIGGELLIYRTSAQAINGFNKLVSVNGISIVDNYPQLNSIKGFGLLQSVPLIDIYGNDLSEFDAFENLESIGEFLRLAQMINVTAIGGFAKLKEAPILEIWQNSQLTDLSNFASLEKVGHIYFERNDVLGELNFPKVTSCTSVTIAFQPSVTNVDGFAGLASVEEINILHNVKLENLDGFGNIQSLSSKKLLQIEGNSSLDDFCGISQLVNNTIFEIYQYDVGGNKFNPTIADIQSGVCRL